MPRLPCAHETTPQPRHSDSISRKVIYIIYYHYGVIESVSDAEKSILAVLYILHRVVSAKVFCIFFEKPIDILILVCYTYVVVRETERQKTAKRCNAKRSKGGEKLVPVHLVWGGCERH